jgi:hypothetical protein
MTPKQKREFHNALHAAMARMREEGAKEVDDPEYMEMLDIMNQCGDYQRMVLAGVDSQLIESGCGPINRVGDLKAEANRKITLTVKDFKTAIQVAISLGTDLGVALVREGVKFPGPVVN